MKHGLSQRNTASFLSPKHVYEGFSLRFSGDELNITNSNFLHCNLRKVRVKVVVREYNGEI
jgi:hypothetical protein